MRLRTFIAVNMAEAIDQIRRELGPDAIIVSSFANDAGMLEVTATVEPASADGEPALAAHLEASLGKRLRGRLHADAHRAIQADEPPAHSGIAFDETLVAGALDAQAVPAELRDALVAAAVALGDDDAVAALAHALETRFSFEPLPVLPRTPVMLVGLPGAGKTVAMAKFAVGALMENAPVDLITTDTERVGAASQGESYGKLLGSPFHSAENADALALLLQENANRANTPPDRSGRSCLIDTASINPFDRVELAGLKRLVDGARVAANAEPVLILAATIDATLSTEIALSFGGFGMRRLIATQVDISHRLGSVLAAADAAHLALAQISVTPYLAHGLSPMNSTVCARLILGTFSPAL